MHRPITLAVLLSSLISISACGAGDASSATHAADNVANKTPPSFHRHSVCAERCPGSAAEVGTLHYSGDYSGAITFKDSDCDVIDGHLVAFNAPHWKNGDPPSQGTQILVTLEENGEPTEFNFVLDEGAAQNTFVTTNQTRPIQGIHVRKADGTWEVVFDGFRVAGTNWMQTMDSSKGKWVTLRGELHCTHVK